MSGHSKWSQIKRQKGAADLKKGVIFTKLANTITVAVREGGQDPTMNFRLRLAIDKARAANVPKENIARAINRGTGELEGSRLANVTYEGFGPGGAAIVVETLTDNRNRTAGELRRIFAEHGGNLGNANSVLWMFERRGVLEVKPTGERASFELAAIDAGALDISENDGVVISTSPGNLRQLRDAILKTGADINSTEIALIPKTSLALTEAGGRRLERLLHELEDLQDVTNVATNANV
ncbi:MAG: YebC/PmpR family DNA-binding transcriptional regulator [Candidatus Kerfeldbacteria bacterium]|nr:YebC/PmpR family DNA-binding transcriptional regulator [Candidatus Kerfeldbacteria bacterium]